MIIMLHVSEHTDMRTQRCNLMCANILWVIISMMLTNTANITNANTDEYNMLHDLIYNTSKIASNCVGQFFIYLVNSSVKFLTQKIGHSSVSRYKLWTS